MLGIGRKTGRHQPQGEEKNAFRLNGIRKGKRFRIVLTTAITTWFFNELPTSSINIYIKRYFFFWLWWLLCSFRSSELNTTFPFPLETTKIEKRHFYSTYDEQKCKLFLFFLHKAYSYNRLRFYR